MGRLIGCAAVMGMVLAVPAALHAQRMAPPAAAVPLASPTGGAEVGILVHWNDDTTPIYGFAFRTLRPARRTHFQAVFGQPRGFGGNWIGGASYDMGVPITRTDDGWIDVHAAGQLLFDRREDALHLRVPGGVRGERTFALNALLVTPLLAGGGSAGAVSFAGWEEYGGVYGEAGLRLELFGGWAQGSVLLEQRLLGGDDRSAEPRWQLRFGFIPAATN